MDPVSLIISALVAGVASASSETAGKAIRDGYAGLVALVKRKFAGDTKAEEALADHAADPETYEKPLAKHLQAAGAADSEEILAAARRVLELAESAGIGASKYQVDAHGSQGVQVGDGGSMNVHVTAASPQHRPD